jgi:hypothetical protein
MVGIFQAEKTYIRNNESNKTVEIKHYTTVFAACESIHMAAI